MCIPACMVWRVIQDIIGIGLVVGYVNRWGDGGLNFLHLIFAFCA